MRVTKQKLISFFLLEVLLLKYFVIIDIVPCW